MLQLVLVGVWPISRPRMYLCLGTWTRCSAGAMLTLRTLMPATRSWLGNPSNPKQMRSAPQTVEKAKIPNFLIVAIDTQLRDYLTERGVNVYYKDIQARPLSMARLRIIHMLLRCDCYSKFLWMTRSQST